MISRSLLLAAGLLAAAPSHAAVLSYSFATLGEGYVTGSPGAPNPYTRLFLNNATFTFLVDTTSIQQDPAGGEFFVNSGFSGSSSPTGIGVTANINASRDVFNGSASVCFDNPTGNFLRGSATITSTCQNRLAASGYGSSNGLFEYAGKVISLTVTEENTSYIPRIVNGVPEPSTWALMLAGFGLVGYAMRRRVKVAFA